jgi:hypothetical protein
MSEDRVCPGCDKPLPEGSPPHKKYHDNACKMRYYRRTKPSQYRSYKRPPHKQPPPPFQPDPPPKLPDNLGDLTSKEILLLRQPASVIIALLKPALEREEAERQTRNRSKEEAKEEDLALDPKTARRVARILAKERHAPGTGTS